MDLRSQSLLLASLVILALAIAAFLRPKRDVWVLYAITCLSLCGVYVSEFLSRLLGPAPWTRTTLFFACLAPAATLAFYGEFLGSRPWNAGRLRLISILSLLGGLAVALTPLSTFVLAQACVVAWSMGGLLFALSSVMRARARSPSPSERSRLAYLAIGGGIAIATSGLDLLSLFSIPIPPLGPLCTTLYLWLITLSLQRRRLLDLNELLGKTAALAIQALALATIYFVLLYWIGDQPSIFIFNALVASVVVLILVDPLRSKLDAWVIATLFRERFQLIRTLGTLKSRLATVIDVHDATTLVLDTFHETRRITHASLYLLSEDKPGFWRVDHRGPAPSQSLSAAGARSLISYTLRGRKAVLLENLDRRIAELRGNDESAGRKLRDEAKRLGELKAALGQMRAGITLPIASGDRIIGFLNFWDERVPEAFASDEIAAIIEIAERLATVIENSKLYERLKERDRLASLGEMAAGLAHEIRNPLGAIKGAAQMLDPVRAGEDGEFLDVIVEEVNRLSTVVTHFLDYSRPLKQSFAPTDLAEVVARTLKLLGPEIPANVTLHFDPADRLPKVSADAEQLRQVLINLTQNAFQAMPTGGALTLILQCPEELQPWRLSATPELVELRVRDSGVGFDEEAQRHLFVPFYTTKEKGTGLGLAICHRIVTNHGGSLTATSRVGEGTEFVIRLPAIPGSRPEAPLASPDLTPFPGALQVARMRRRR